MGKLSVMLFLLLSLNAQGDPEREMNRVLQSLFFDIQQLSDPTIDDYQNLITTHLNPYIDTLNMSQLILGHNWKRASAKQKQRFMGCFIRQLNATQAHNLRQWQFHTWGNVKKEFNENQTKVAITIEFKNSENTHDLILRLHLIDEKWRIYDASYLGISLLKNFKDDYAVRINNQGLSKTLAQLCEQYPNKRKSLVIAGKQWPPFIARSLPGQGISVEIVSTVLSNAGYDVNMTFAPWKKVMKSMNQGAYDISVATWKNPKRELHLWFSDAYLSTQLVALTHKNAAFSFDSLQGALSHSLSLGLIEDYAYSDHIKRYHSRRYVKQHATLLRDVATGNLDFALLDKQVALYHLGRSPAISHSLTMLPVSLETQPLYISMSKQNPDAKRIIHDFNRYLKIYLKSDAYKTLLSQYGIEYTH